MKITQNHIYLGDCLEVMKDIEDNSIDMILCDLPYGVTKCKWASVIPLEPLWVHYKRIAKDHAAIVLTATQPFTSKLVMSNLKMFKYDWVWDKRSITGFLWAKKKPLRDKEDILIFYKEETIYNPQHKKGKAYSKKRRGEIEVYKEERISKYYDENRYPKQILSFPVKNPGLHPTQKPLLLFEYLIKTYTNPGMLVLDNCAGSGTTGVAAKRLHRNYILIEKEEKYYKLAKARVEAAKPYSLEYLYK